MKRGSLSPPFFADMGSYTSKCTPKRSCPYCSTREQLLNKPYRFSSLINLFSYCLDLSDIQCNLSSLVSPHLSCHSFYEQDIILHKCFLSRKIVKYSHIAFYIYCKCRKSSFFVIIVHIFRIFNV